MFLNGFKSVIRNPYYLFFALSRRCYGFPFLSDKFYLKCCFRAFMGKKLSLSSPKSFNEKLQWLKLNDRRPEYIDLVDKYKVRSFVARTIGEEHLIPLLGVWNSFDEIDFSKLPNQFVLKCTHDSGSVLICNEKSSFDFKAAEKKLRKCLKRNPFYIFREWPYKNVLPRIIGEKYMQDTLERVNSGLTDYKFFCFNGIVDCVMVCLDRHLNNTKFYFFDKEWKLKRINERGKKASENFTLPKPPTMDRMFEIAAQLSYGFPFVRVDLYECQNEIFFGELTFYPDGGFDSNFLPETDAYFGNMIDIDLKSSTNEK